MLASLQGKEYTSPKKKFEKDLPNYYRCGPTISVDDSFDYQTMFPEVTLERLDRMRVIICQDSCLPNDSLYTFIHKDTVSMSLPRTHSREMGKL